MAIKIAHITLVVALSLGLLGYTVKAQTSPSQSQVGKKLEVVHDEMHAGKKLH